MKRFSIYSEIWTHGGLICQAERRLYNVLCDKQKRMMRIFGEQVTNCRTTGACECIDR